MNKEFFITSMRTLTGSYSNFDLTKEQLEIWYGFFKNNTEQEFKEMLQVFMNTNIYPPLGANHIKQVYAEEMKKQIKSNDLSPDEAWKLVRGAIRVYSPNYHRVEYLNYIKERSELAWKLANEYIYEIDGATPEQLDFLATRFKKGYEVLLERKSSDEQLKLTNQVVKNLLENKRMIESDE